MKVNSENYLNHINNKKNQYKFILFYGTNNGLVNSLFNATLSTLSINSNDPFDVSKLTTENIVENSSCLTEALSTYSMVSSQRYVLLNICNYTLNKNTINVILSSIKLDIEGCVLIIKADNLGSQSELVKFSSNSKSGLLIACYEESLGNIKTKLSNILNDNNQTFNSSFISLLSSKFSNDSSINQMELEKLETFLMNNNKVNESTLLNFIINNTDININKIAIHCASGNIEKALFFYQKSIQSSILPLFVLKAILKHLNLIERILFSVNDGNSIDYAINSLKPPVFFKDKPHLTLQASLWTIERTKTVKKRLIDAEIKCKSYAINEKLFVAQLILSISVIARNLIRI